MPVLPPELDSIIIISDITERVVQVEGYLRRREIELLALLAACPTAPGIVLEIGCYMGKSTIALAQGAALAGEETIVTVDPLPMDGALEKLHQNLRAAGVDRIVEFHQMRSEELAGTWTRPLRLLWIDGDHAYESKIQDFELFAPFLSDGAIVAFHDVLNRFEGPVRTFMEKVLLSDHFGATGICGSIGWGQYFRDPARCHAHRAAKLRLYRKLSRLVPSVAYNTWPTGFSRIRHEFYRCLIPQGCVSPKSWARCVA